MIHTIRTEATRHASKSNSDNSVLAGCGANEAELEAPVAVRVAGST